MADRIVVLIDMDCFYVQVEQRRQPEFLNKPAAVVQYNKWKGGGIIAVNYEARDLGVRRGMRGDQAKAKCPDIHLFQVPELRGKANLTRYRDAGVEVMDVLCEFGDCAERASIDEAFLDFSRTVSEQSSHEGITEDLLPNTFVVGYDIESCDEAQDDGEHDGADIRKVGLKQWLESSVGSELDAKLAAAAVIVERMRDTVYEKTGFRCSAGISYNKMLAKLACGLHKPNRQTILPKDSVPQFFRTFPINKVRSLGGKLGDEVKEKFSIDTMGQLSDISLGELQKTFGTKTGSYLHEVAQGLEFDPVTSRQLAKSIGCGKNFTGKAALSSESQIRYWLGQLSEELQERLEKDKDNNRRKATLLTVSFRRKADRGPGLTSRSCPLYMYDSVKLARDAFDIIQKSENQIQPIINLSMSAGKFQDSVNETIKNFFRNAPKDSAQNTDRPNLSSAALPSQNPLEINHGKKKDNAETSNNHKKETTGFFAKRMQQRALNEASEDVSVGSATRDAVERSPNKFVEIPDDDERDSNSTESCDIDKRTLPHLPVNICEETENVLNEKTPVKAEKFFGKSMTVPKPSFDLCFPSTSTDGLEASAKLEKDGDNFANYRCEQCNEWISIALTEEHLDLHFAQELQVELRREERNNASDRKPAVSVAKLASSSSRGAFRGKRRGRPKKESPVDSKKMRKLESYFT